MPVATYHKHHIVPRHVGGTNDPFNIIRLTLAGHAFAHWCLWMRFGRLHDKLAWQLLSGYNEEAEQTRRKMQFGRPVSPETRAKIRASLMGKRNALGYVPTPEQRANMSRAHIGNQNARKKMVVGEGVEPSTGAL